MAARRERRCGDDCRIRWEWNRQPFAKEEEGDQCIPVVCHQPDKMRRHIRNGWHLRCQTASALHERHTVGFKDRIDPWLEPGDLAIEEQRPRAVAMPHTHRDVEDVRHRAIMLWCN